MVGLLNIGTLFNLMVTLFVLLCLKELAGCGLLLLDWMSDGRGERMLIQKHPRSLLCLWINQ